MKLVLTSLMALAACIPTAARRNAKVEPGFDLDVVAGGQYILEGENESGEPTEVDQTVHAELGLQWGTALNDGGAIAVQVKVPITLVYTTLDVYWQLPNEGEDLFVGVGAELSGAPALYLAVTRYLNESVYVTFTPRVLSQFDNLAVNPQLAFGLDAGTIDISAFAGYQHVFGEGIDVDVDLFSESDDRDRRHDFAIVGISLRL